MISNIEYYKMAVASYCEPLKNLHIDLKDDLVVLCNYTTYAPINLETAPKIEYAYRKIFQMQAHNWREEISNFPEETFELKKTDQKFGLDEGEEPTTVSFRAATEFQNDLHEKYYEALLEKWELTENQRVINQYTEFFKRFTPVIEITPEHIRKWKYEFVRNEISWFDIFLTLTGSNINDRQNKIFFPKFEVKGSAYLDLNDEEFRERFESLPKIICSEIYEKMLEINPWWIL